MAIRTRLGPTQGAKGGQPASTPRPDGSPRGPSLTDTVGEVVAVESDAVVVRTRGGEVRLALADVVAARVIPPRPTRRGAPHRAISIEDLHLVMTKGNPGLETAWLGRPGGGWLLRAGGGWTGRANSVLPVGDPGMPDDDAVREVVAWYRERELVAHVMLPLPEHARWVDDPLGALLIAQGWFVSPPVLVMTGRSADLGSLPAGAARVESAADLTEEWLAAAGPRVRGGGEVAQVVLTAPRDQAFLLARDGDGAPVGAARVAFDDGWAGVFGVHVRPDQRRRGVGAALTAAAGRIAQDRGVTLAYLQVERANTAAVALYERAGMDLHHHYAYLALRPPTPPSPTPAPAPAGSEFP
ncbi:GNAT family N-acetyltransferase [Marihabitans asiaticum]|uniref:Ribosomal protein S18 acetylase RimI-like enzyme n=2 Tax=Marihabitans asiaticum TaxID=415218 RepID=A0A560WIA5_9MICO|nr:ribosomal protein S18 acetylase RimI-like enzyme [Marihabitans asiaticum]